MKSRFQLYLILTVVSAFLLLFAGCYTQVGTTRDDGQDEYGSTQYDNDSSSAGGYDSGDYGNGSNQGYGDDQWDSWHHRAMLGFSYYSPSCYWPSVAFNMAYADPWYYDSWGYGGSYYGSSYYGYSPYYGYSGYSPYYYSSYYPYYPYASYRYVSATSGHRGSRDFGSTRGVGSTRGAGSTQGGTDVRTDVGGFTPDRGGYNLPGASRIDRGAPTGVTNTTNGKSPSNPRDVGNARAVSPKNDGRSSGNSSGVRAWGSRGGTTRTDGNRQPNNGNGGSSFKPPASSATPSSRSGSKSGNGPAKHSAPRHGSRDSGSSRSGNTPPSYTPPSYTPPPSPPQQQQAPPPSSAPANTGSRGGSTRGGRP